MTDYANMSMDELFSALEVAVRKNDEASQPGVPVSRQHKKVAILNQVGEEILRRDPSEYRPRFIAMLKAEDPALRYQAALVLKHTDTELAVPVLLELLPSGVSSRWELRCLMRDGYWAGPMPE